MSLSISDVANIAQLAKLSLDLNSNKTVVEDLNNIFKLAAQLTKLDTESIAPLAHPLESLLTTRADVVTQTGIHRARLQKLAPSLDADLYLVPQVIE